jgi:nitrilase
MLSTVKIAACHVSPIFLNPEKTTEKALCLIDEASSHGAHLVAFPESYIPGFPVWAGTGAPVDNPGLFARFVEASIYADGPEIAQIQSRCAERRVVVSIGFSERSRYSVGCLWNSNIVIGEDGKVLAHHRKMCRTFPV